MLSVLYSPCRLGNAYMASVLCDFFQCPNSHWVLYVTDAAILSEFWLQWDGKQLLVVKGRKYVISDIKLISVK